MPDSLVVFARAPIPGQTKTRLARVVGEAAATDFAAAMLRDTLETARAGRWETHVAFSPPDAFGDASHSLARFWNGPRFPQIEGDIGARMLAALGHKTASERVVLIGSDVPDLPASILRKAFAALETHDLVFGPAHDGGFYLIGAASEPPTNLFDGVIWSSDTVLETTLANARSLQVKTAQLQMWRDIDEWDDLVALQARVKNTLAAPHTRKQLERLQNVFDTLHRLEVG